MESYVKDQIFLGKKQTFSSSVNKITMKFKDPKIENSYQKSRFKHKNIFILIGLCLVGNIMIMNIRVIQIFFIILFQIDNTIKTTFFSSLLSILLLIVCNIFELIIYLTNQVKILRGFFICILIMISGISSSLDNSLSTCDSRIPLFVPTFVFGIMLLILISFHFSDNWICGSIQIICLIVGIDYYIITYPFPWLQDKSFLLAISLMACISFIVSIYYFEYFHRKLTYRRIISKLQQKTIEEIISTLPEPILLTQKGKINWANNAFYEIEKDSNIIQQEMLNENPNSIRSLRENRTNDLIVHNEIILNSLISKTGKKSLGEKITQNCRINNEQFLYISKNKRKQFFEVNSSVMKIQSQQNYILYFLKDLTIYEKVKDLKIKKKYQRIYFASVTHDFRTPLGIISGNSELLLDSEENPDKKKSIRNIYNASTLLSLLVQDILDFTQIKAGTLKLNNIEFNIEKEFKIIIDLFEEKFKSKGLYLSININPKIPNKIISDSNRLKQILMNLISNAFKFTSKGGVQIKVNIEDSNANIILVKVKDSGVGIAKKDIPKLFQEFGKLENHSELNPNGIGLGLRICKQIIEKLGGKICVKSRLEYGTTFSFTFTNLVIAKNKNLYEDIKNDEPDEIGKSFNKEEKEVCFTENIMIPKEKENNDMLIFKEENPLQIRKKIKIKKKCYCTQLLIVEDEFSLRQILIEFAKKCNIKFDEVENGLKSLEKVKEKISSKCCPVYQLILMDYNMPIMNGINAALKIKEFLNGILLVSNIILLSGIGPEEQKVIMELTVSPFAQIEQKPLSYQKMKEIFSKYIY